MTTEKLHEILDDENRELTIEELCQVLYELKTDCFQKYSEELEANKIPTSQFYLGEQNAFQIALDLMEHVKKSEDVRKEIEVETCKKFAEDLKDKLVEVTYDTGEFEYYVYDVTDTHIAIDELVKAKVEEK